MSERKTPALETWAMGTAADLFPAMEYDDQVKLAIGLIQARATEAIHYSGKFSVGNYLSAIIEDGHKLHIPTEAAFALAFSDRHAQLENFGMEWATRYLKEKEEGKGVIN